MEEIRKKIMRKIGGVRSFFVLIWNDLEFEIQRKEEESEKNSGSKIEWNLNQQRNCELSMNFLMNFSY